MRDKCRRIRQSRVGRGHMELCLEVVRIMLSCTEEMLVRPYLYSFISLINYPQDNVTTDQQARPGFNSYQLPTPTTCGCYLGMSVRRIRGGYRYIRTHIHFQKSSLYSYLYPSSFQNLSPYLYPSGISKIRILFGYI